MSEIRSRKPFHLKRSRKMTAIITVIGERLLRGKQFTMANAHNVPGAARRGSLCE